MHIKGIICALHGNDGKNPEEPTSPKASRAKIPKRSKSKLITFELYAKFSTERNLGKEHKLYTAHKGHKIKAQ